MLDHTPPPGRPATSSLVRPPAEYPSKPSRAVPCGSRPVRQASALSRSMVADGALRQRKSDSAVTNGEAASSSATTKVMAPRPSKPGAAYPAAGRAAARHRSSLGGMATLAVFYAIVVSCFDEFAAAGCPQVSDSALPASCHQQRSFSSAGLQPANCQRSRSWSRRSGTCSLLGTGCGLTGQANLTLAAVAQTWYAQHRLYWTPRPLGPDAPEAAFSEARAMAHTFHLASTIGDRQARLFGDVYPKP